MHYACLVITKSFPNDEELERVLRPFNDEDYYSRPEDDKTPRPPILWDWWEIGGRYAGKFKLEIRKDDKEYRWEYYANEPREGRLFRSYAFYKMKALIDQKKIWMLTEEKFYPLMGLRDGFLYVDGARIRDIKNLKDLSCYCFIDADGNGYARESYNKDTGWSDVPDFEEKLEKMIEEVNKDWFVCIVDLHD